MRTLSRSVLRRGEKTSQSEGKGKTCSKTQECCARSRYARTKGQGGADERNTGSRGRDARAKGASCVDERSTSCRGRCSRASEGPSGVDERGADERSTDCGG